ncbi:MAG: SDR family NAD(P)-dependent oxidoreductase [Archangiaceae bacterium]|nr:SDR family NAD(P)-dependent oxidoreductase [Archangiaceae bacterium]
MSKLSPEELRRITEVLERLDHDRTLIADLPDEDRKAFLRAVGKVAIPERSVQHRLAKAVRRKRSRNEKAAQRERDKATRAEVQIRTVRAQPVYVAPQLPSGEERKAPERELETPRHCYVCKAEFKKLHFFYDTMCTACGDLNHAKRFQTAPLEGKVALITGARVKIGYQASLMLLRSGARVIATTRFPLDAAERYAREADFSKWGHRLEVHGLDLRHAPSVEVFARHIEATHERLDILINNAAQTVRRPPGWYRHLLEGESRQVQQLDAPLRPLLESRQALLEKLAPPSTDALTTSWRSSDAAVGIHHSAALSLLPYEMEQDVDGAFPLGTLDADLQQVDKRLVNSWRLTLAEVQTAEMLEVHLVNAVAPFILCGKLKSLMLRHREAPGHIVNVSAMEGSFSRGTKTDKHPHTNMAKAALNMLTLTSAPDYAKSRIYMNAVDTGWVTDEDPLQHAERKQSELDFHPPLDIVDGAARVVDPVFEAERTKEYVWGKFFKDYTTTSW